MNCCRLGAFCVHHTTMHMSRHFRQSYTRRLHACLAATCHLHFWQNDRDLLRATAETREWSGHRNKSQHRKLTLEKKILWPLLQGFEPAAFQSQVLCSNHWSIMLLHTCVVQVLLLASYRCSHCCFAPVVSQHGCGLYIGSVQQFKFYFCVERHRSRIFFKQDSATGLSIVHKRKQRAKLFVVCWAGLA